MHRSFFRISLQPLQFHLLQAPRPDDAFKGTFVQTLHSSEASIWRVGPLFWLPGF